MKVIYSTRRIEILVDDNDYEWLNDFSWSVVAGGYAYCRELKEYMHRLILDAKPEEHVDHKFHNTLNNQRWNLKITTRSKNMLNQRKNRGAWFNKQNGKWKAGIVVEHKKIHIGFFDTEQEAVNAYRQYKIATLQL